MGEDMTLCAVATRSHTFVIMSAIGPDGGGGGGVGAAEPVAVVIIKDDLPAPCWA
jgi:uncharacterized spore protein YtfJ